MHNLSAVNCFLLFVKAFQYLSNPDPSPNLKPSPTPTPSPTPNQAFQYLALIPQLHFLFATLSAALVDLAF